MTKNEYYKIPESTYKHKEGSIIIIEETTTDKYSIYIDQQNPNVQYWRYNNKTLDEVNKIAAQYKSIIENDIKNKNFLKK
jgi:hypothetical protein